MAEDTEFTYVYFARLSYWHRAFIFLIYALVLIFIVGIEIYFTQIEP